MFDNVNEKVADISAQVGTTPQAWNGSIFSMIQNLSETIILPIAGVILAFVMTLELIQLITDKNNLNDVDTWMFFKWIMKTACAILIVTNTWTIVMGVFDAAQGAVKPRGGCDYLQHSYRHQLCCGRPRSAADGDGYRPSVRPVVPKPVCRYYDVGAVHLHFHHRVWAYD
jgi:hypothetical protein